MTVVVRISVQHHDGHLATTDYQTLTIIALGHALAKKAFRIGPGQQFLGRQGFGSDLFPQNISHSPGRPNLFVIHLFTPLLDGKSFSRPVRILFCSEIAGKIDKTFLNITFFKLNGLYRRNKIQEKHKIFQRLG
jgi:hypothetical protein